MRVFAAHHDAPRRAPRDCSLRGGRAAALFSRRPARLEQLPRRSALRAVGAAQGAPRALRHLYLSRAVRRVTCQGASCVLTKRSSKRAARLEPVGTTRRTFFFRARLASCCVQDVPRGLTPGAPRALSAAQDAPRVLRRRFHTGHASFARRAARRAARLAKHSATRCAPRAVAANARVF